MMDKVCVCCTKAAKSCREAGCFQSLKRLFQEGSLSTLTGPLSALAWRMSLHAWIFGPKTWYSGACSSLEAHR